MARRYRRCPECDADLEPDDLDCPECAAPIHGRPAPGMPPEVIVVTILHVLAGFVCFVVACVMLVEQAKFEYAVWVAGAGVLPMCMAATVFVRHVVTPIVNVVWAVLCITGGAILFLLGVPFLLCWLVGLIPMAVGAAILGYGVAVAVFTARGGYNGYFAGPAD